MIRTYKYPLEPNRRQKAILERWLEKCRLLYNVALEQRREWYRMAKRSLGYNEQTKELTELRTVDPTYAEVPVSASRSALRSLDGAFKAFFRRLKQGETPGYPRFKGKDRFDSFGVGRVSVEGRKLRIPKLGLVKFRKYRDLGGDILDVRVVRKAGKWAVAFSCNLGEAPANAPLRSMTGVDVGLSSFATLSSGEKIENPRFFRVSEERLARRQRILARKKRGSRNRTQAKLLVQKAHEHVRNQRQDFARKLAASLFQRYDCVFYEDLNLRSLTRGPLSKSIMDASWGKFIAALTFKAECAGKLAIAVNPRGTSIRCSTCAKDVIKTIADRVHRCENCGLAMDRDENAARNILALGRSVAAVFGQSPN